MPTLEHIRALGQEIERQRIARGIPTVQELSRMSGMSKQRMGEIIKGYRHPTRGFTVPTDDALDRIAEALDMPVSRLHALLGRFPEVPFPAFEHADTVDVAEAYDRLPEFGRKLVRDVIRSVQEVAASVEGAHQPPPSR
jgi:transcriptional regulator with XRE-family HTH domain